MGNFNITISGSGSCYEAERSAKIFVADLRQRGLTIDLASVTMGTQTDCLQPPPPLRERLAANLANSMAGLVLAILLLLPTAAAAQAPKAPDVVPPDRALLVFDVTPGGAEIWVNGTKVINHKILTAPIGPGFWNLEAKVRWCDGKSCFEQKVKTKDFQRGEVVKVKVIRGQPNAPPGDLPGALIEGATPGPDGVNFGIDPNQLKAHPESHTINGKEVPKIEAIQAISAGLTDDRKNMRLTVIGTPEFRKSVAEGLAQPEASAIRERLVMQQYTPDAWQVKEAGFRGGNQIYLQAPDGKVLHRQEDFAGGAPKLLEAIRKVDPNYRPERDPDLRTAGGDELTLLALLMAAAFLAYSL